MGDLVPALLKKTIELPNADMNDLHQDLNYHSLGSVSTWTKYFFSKIINLHKF
jgi:hypothetical protein